ncbi:hypothetical protein QAD02_015316, partial [Eretmocerus hayati]
YFNTLMTPVTSINEDETVNVKLPSYISDFEGLLNKTPKRVQANYAMWRIIKESASYLNDQIRERELAFLTVISGTSERETRWEECTEILGQQLPLSIGSIYARNYFNRDAKKNAERMVLHIQSEAKKILQKPCGRIQDSTLGCCCQLHLLISQPLSGIITRRLTEPAAPSRIRRRPVAAKVLATNTTPRPPVLPAEVGKPEAGEGRRVSLIFESERISFTDDQYFSVRPFPVVDIPRDSSAVRPHSGFYLGVLLSVAFTDFATPERNHYEAPDRTSGALENSPPARRSQVTHTLKTLFDVHFRVCREYLRSYIDIGDVDRKIYIWHDYISTGRRVAVTGSPEYPYCLLSNQKISSPVYFGADLKVLRETWKYLQELLASKAWSVFFKFDELNDIYIDRENLDPAIILDCPLEYLRSYIDIGDVDRKIYIWHDYISTGRRVAVTGSPEYPYCLLSNQKISSPVYFGADLKVLRETWKYLQELLASKAWSVFFKFDELNDIYIDRENLDPAIILDCPLLRLRIPGDLVSCVSLQKRTQPADPAAHPPTPDPNPTPSKQGAGDMDDLYSGSGSGEPRGENELGDDNSRAASDLSLMADISDLEDETSRLHLLISQPLSGIITRRLTEPAAPSRIRRRPVAAKVLATNTTPRPPVLPAEGEAPSRIRRRPVAAKINGVNTQDEDTSDNGGTKLAYLAYNEWERENGVEPRLPGLQNYTPQQMFWISAGQTWCSNQKLESLINKIKRNWHSPSEFRVNGPMSNIAMFAKDFNCPPTSRMNPSNKCIISLPSEERRNITAQYNPTTVRELANRYRFVPWLKYFNTLMAPVTSINEDETVNVKLPSYISDLEGLLNKTPKRVQANYAMWRIIKESASYLNDQIRERELAFLTVTSDISAGYLQGPYYSSDRPNYMNFGTIGYAIGHEITHGFDNFGSQFDREGNTKNWWSKGTKNEFLRRVQCIIDQARSYNVSGTSLKVSCYYLNTHKSQFLGPRITENWHLLSWMYEYTLVVVIQNDGEYT